MTENPAETDSWIELRPSNVNLALTLAASLAALGVLFLIDVPEWARAAVAAALFIATAADVYFVRMRHARAVVAFRLTRVEEPVSSERLAQAGAPNGEMRLARELRIRLRYRNAKATGAAAEAEGIVMPRCYVSTYFTSIAYALPGDPGWRKWFPRVLPLWADGIDAECFRQVRVSLKWR